MVKLGVDCLLPAQQYLAECHSKGSLHYDNIVQSNGLGVRHPQYYSNGLDESVVFKSRYTRCSASSYCMSQSHATAIEELNNGVVVV